MERGPAPKTHLPAAPRPPTETPIWRKQGHAGPRNESRMGPAAPRAFEPEEGPTPRRGWAGTGRPPSPTSPQFPRAHPCCLRDLARVGRSAAETELRVRRCSALWFLIPQEPIWKTRRHYKFSAADHWNPAGSQMFNFIAPFFATFVSIRPFLKAREVWRKPLRAANSRAENLFCKVQTVLGGECPSLSHPAK